MKAKNYYYIAVIGRDNDDNRVCGGHVIKAKSKKDALRIREKYGISNPRFAQGRLKITCYKVDFADVELKSMNENLIKRRKHGVGGSIWYEEDNELKIEKD